MRRFLSLVISVGWSCLGAAFFQGPAIAEKSQPAPAGVRIALVTDTHTTRGTGKDQPLYRGRLDKVIADVNAKGVAWVLIAGDLTQGGRDEELADFQAQIKGFHAPVSCVFGNHDVGAKSKEGTKEGVTAERVERFEAAMGPSFWAEERAGVRVVGITASLLGSGLKREAEQWDFLEKTLAPRPAPQATLVASAPRTTGAAPVPTLLLTHYPLFLKAFDEPGDDYWNIEPAPRARLLDLLQKGDVKAVLSGHLHRPLQNDYRGVRFVTSLPVSFGLPRDHQPEGWTLITVSARGEINAETQTIND